MKKTIKTILCFLGLSCLLSMSALADTPTFSEYWYQDSSGSWKVKDASGNIIKNAWLCDDAVASNGQDIWYLIDSNGNMVSAGLVQDQTGNIYSLETSHNGYYGMLRYKSGAYDGIYLDLESSHGGSFANIKNQDGRAGLQAIYGLTQVNIDNSNCVYTSSFRNSNQNTINNENGDNKLKKEHPDDKVIVNGVDISQYLIDKETSDRDREEFSDSTHDGRNAPSLN